MKKWGWKGMTLFMSLSLCFFGSSFSTTFAQEKDFPKKEITIVVNFAAGGGRDILARGVGKVMTKYLGVPIVVMNMPGAGGARGLTQVYHSPPDGYTLGVGAAAEITDQILQEQDYDNKKFSYIGRAQSMPLFFFVKSDSPLRSIKDFKTYGKPLRISAFSLGAQDKIAAMILANREGFPLTIVGGYQGVAAAILAVIRGEVEFTGAQPSTTISYVKAGQIRPILTLDKKRSPDFPDIPTIGEIGHKDLDILSLDYWFIAPPEVPKPRIQILEDALMKTLKDPEFLGWAKGAGIEPSFLSSKETTEMVLNFFKLLEPYKGEIEKYIKK